jgi:hypothetical protein
VKNSGAVLVFLCSATGAYAQQPPAAAPKMECRDLSTSGNVVFPNETIENGKACHVVVTKPAAQTAAATPPQPQQVIPAAPVSPAATSATPAPPAELASMRINSGSTVFIAPMGGFENYIAAALRKKDVPLMPIEDESKANYVLRGNSDEKKTSFATIALADESANVQLIDRRTGAIVFAYAMTKKNTLHGQQSAAEACVKHLKEQIDK